MKTSISQIFEQTIQSDENYIFIKPLCDFFGINPENQSDRIKNDPILAKSSLKKSMKTMGGDNYPRVCLDKRGFIRWIQIINPNIIAENLRESFLNYQEMIFEYFYGIAEEQMLIGQLSAKLQELKSEYSLLGNEIRITQRDLFDSLNRQYQYSLPFDRQNKIT